MVTGTARTGTTTQMRWSAREWSLLIVLSGNMLLDAVEISVVLVALPSIASRLSATPWEIQWLMSGFALGFAAMLALGPRISAKTGRRRAYLGAMFLFGLISITGGFTGNLGVLVAIRVAMGCCAALTAPAGLAVINETFPEGHQRQRAVSVYSFVGATGFTAGLLFAGLVVRADWHWIFFFPAPVVPLLLLCGLRVLPREQQNPARHPRLALLRDHSLRRSALSAACLNGTYQSLLVLITFQAQRKLGWTPWLTALALLPACVPLLLTAPFTGGVIARYGTRRLIGIGTVFPPLGYVFYLARPDGAPYALSMLPALLLVEAGFCCSFVALNLQATASAEPSDKGAAVSLYQMCVQLGVGVLLPLVVLLAGHAWSVRPSLIVVSVAGAIPMAASIALSTPKSLLRRPRMADPSTDIPVNPVAIMAPMAGYWQAKILLAAVEHDVFTELSTHPATSSELASRLGLVEPGTHDFLVGLSHLGLLVQADGTFTNSAEADAFLVRGRPGYLGGYLQFCDRELNPAWDGLATSLRTGKPHNRAAINGNPYDTLYSDAEATDNFLDSMDLLSTPIAVALSQLDWSRYTSFVDVGGARGTFAHQLVSQNPHLTGAVFDLPQLEPAFRRHVESLNGAASPIEFLGGDFFTDKLPEADALIFGHVLHNWGIADRVKLLKSAYDAVSPGGAVFVYDPMAAGNRPPMHAVLASLAMLVWSSGGHEYAVEDLRGWLSEAGFRPETAQVPDLHDEVLVIGHKDR